MTTKLHEILAVEGGLEKTAKKLVLSSKKQFDKENLFNGQVRTLVMFDSNQAHLNTTETIKLETTVDENLDYALKAVGKHWDAVLQKDLANQIAKADIVIDGVTLAKDVPATTLLGLESKLTELRSLFEAMPTLAPGISWVRNEADKEGIFSSRDPVTQFKTEKDIDFRILYEATKEHPAQVAEMNVVKNVGKYLTSKTSGMLTPHRKAKILARLETLQSGIKKARQRANNAIVENRQISKDLINFIIKD